MNSLINGINNAEIADPKSITTVQLTGQRFDVVIRRASINQALAEKDKALAESAKALAESAKALAEKDRSLDRAVQALVASGMTEDEAKSSLGLSPDDSD